jgi:hypothetical protein
VSLFFAEISMTSTLCNLGWVRSLIMCAAVATASLANASDTLVRFSNGETISQADLSAYLEKRVDLRPTSRSAWGVQTVLREMAAVRVFSLEGKQVGVPHEEGREAQRFDDIYAQAVYAKLAPACTPPADEKASRQYFNDNPQAFRVPPMARLSRVILPATETVEGESAAAWLMKEAGDVAAGKKSFDDLTKQAEAVYKLDPQGDLGWITLFDEEASVLRVLATAKQGEMVGPLREGNFAYLFKVNEKREGRQLAWEEVALSVPARSVAYCRQEGAKKVRSDLFAKYGVELDNAAIRAMFLKQTMAK